MFNSIDDLLQGVTFREPLNASDSKSDAALERVVIDGKRYVLKQISFTNDWLSDLLVGPPTTPTPLPLWECQSPAPVPCPTAT